MGRGAGESEIGGGGSGAGTGRGTGSGGGQAAQPCELAPGVPCRDNFEVVRPITLSDVAHYLVADTVQQMEPDGWVVAKLPANFYSSARAHVVSGTLLGSPADVRFTPIRWNWDYGDGQTARPATPGATWAALGLREFDATPTSHIYARPGEYTVRLTITYRAEYRYAGDDFIPITGTITRPANDLHITARGAKTVLVDRDCLTTPTGPGC